MFLPPKVHQVSHRRRQILFDFSHNRSFDVVKSCDQQIPSACQSLEFRLNCDPLCDLICSLTQCLSELSFSTQYVEKDSPVKLQMPCFQATEALTVRVHIVYSELTHKVEEVDCTRCSWCFPSTPERSSRSTCLVSGLFHFLLHSTKNIDDR